MYRENNRCTARLSKTGVTCKRADQVGRGFNVIRLLVSQAVHLITFPVIRCHGVFLIFMAKRIVLLEPLIELLTEICFAKDGVGCSQGVRARRPLPSMHLFVSTYSRRQWVTRLRMSNVSLKQ